MCPQITQITQMDVLETRARGASAGGKHGSEGRLRSEQTGFPPVGGDRQIADVSAVNPLYCGIKETICVYLRDLRAKCARGWAALCLRVFVFAMSCSVFLSVPSVPLWFSRRVGGYLLASR